MNLDQLREYISQGQEIFDHIWHPLRKRGHLLLQVRRGDDRSRYRRGDCRRRAERENGPADAGIGIG